jgi:hypothetical protein
VDWHSTILGREDLCPYSPLLNPKYAACKKQADENQVSKYRERKKFIKACMAERARRCSPEVSPLATALFPYCMACGHAHHSDYSAQ